MTSLCTGGMAQVTPLSRMTSTLSTRVLLLSAPHGRARGGGARRCAGDLVDQVVDPAGRDGPE
jgi:hypothetical protein